MLDRIYRAIIGPPRDPLDEKMRKTVALSALLAWIGLGADGLSSSCYGPEQSFLALGQHTHLALFLALATAATVLLISFAYNQVIELFPNGGGGYKVATTLLGPYAGLIAGSALIVDYVLTIVLSVASGADAIFSLLPITAIKYKLLVEFIVLLILIMLNLRGMKESIKFLVPIFFGFVITHLWLIGYGIISHAYYLPQIVSASIQESMHLSHLLGWFFVAGLFLHAYSQGGGTYTGLEAVSNNVNTLAEPRVTTGKRAMFYVAISLSITAAGIILLYLLWAAAPAPGMTLNAVVFSAILQNFPHANLWLWVVLFFEASLLFVGANTGFLGGPAVLANMAMDSWVPNRFRNLSSRLVTHNGIILFGVAAYLLLRLSHGHVGYLVVLYTVNVFVVFAISILGLCRYWWVQRKNKKQWLRHFLFSAFAALVCVVILSTVLISRFFDSGWMAILITGGVICCCLIIKRHYQKVEGQLKQVDKILIRQLSTKPCKATTINNEMPTAVFLVGSSRGAGMHTILNVQRLFPGHFKNFIFMSAGLVDVRSYGGQARLESMQKGVRETLEYFVRFSEQHGFAALAYDAYGTDPVEELYHMAESVHDQFSNCIFFASQLVLTPDNWFTRMLHSATAFSVQRRLLNEGMKVVILPMNLESNQTKNLLK